ncbi:MAG: hypothetical protein CMI09_11965 [Oceanospirillaceae bacterium]|nr:hypothetical protein [Oceanospirillaceae bacterium]
MSVTSALETVVEEAHVDRVGKAGQSLNQHLNQRHDYWLRSNQQAEDLIRRKLERWADETRVILMREFPFQPQLRRMRRWEGRVFSLPPEQQQQKHRLKKIFEQIFKEYRQFCQILGKHVDDDYWLNLDTDIVVDSGEVVEMDENPLFHLEMLLAEWQRTLDHARSEWELQRISQCREQFLQDIDEVLSLLERLHRQLEPLGMSTGILFDLSASDVRTDDLKELKRWTKYLDDDHGAQTISELLGKLRQLELSRQLEQVNARDHKNANWHDNYARDELIGLRLGRDLEHVLPSELALLSDPDTAVLFDLKYIESRLMCFDVQNLDNEPDEDDDNDLRNANRAVRGPMIICVDTSGSMSGPPTTVAKAVTLYLAGQARQEQRPCYLISYATHIEELDLSFHQDEEQDSERNRQNLMTFLTRTFEGGTDLTPALESALNTMNEQEYRRADLLVISDFLMAELPEKLLDRIEPLKQRGNRFHSLVIGETYMLDRLKHLFDQEWVYDPHRSEIQELLTFKNRVTESENQ